jgi:hypothetical protein
MRGADMILEEKNHLELFEPKLKVLYVVVFHEYEHTCTVTSVVIPFLSHSEQSFRISFQKSTAVLTPHDE